MWSGAFRSAAGGGLLDTDGMRIRSLHRYPVKSMQGESLQSCPIDRHGIPGDRAYALLDVESGTIATAKVPRRWSDLLKCSARYLREPARGLPAPVEITLPDGAVHRSDDPDIDDVLTAMLGRSVRLIASVPENAQFEEIWPDIEGLAPREVIEGTTARTEQTGEPISRFDLAAMATEPGGFFDLATVHVITEASLERLAELEPDAHFDIRRYRPNVVLADAGAGFVENTWAGETVDFGGVGRAGDTDRGVALTVSIPTMRCVMTTLAQPGLPAEPNTLRTVARHNRIPIPGMGRWACAGVYAEVAAEGVLSAGDTGRLRSAGESAPAGV